MKVHTMVPNLSVTRNGRSKFALAINAIFATTLALGLMLPFRPAAAEPTANVAKVGTWMVGNQLGLAALVYFRNTGDWEKFFGEAQFRAKEIGVEVKPFPPRPEKSTDGLIKLLEYFNQGDGARVGSDIRRKWGAYHSTLYDVSSRMFHLPLIYDLDPVLGDKMAQTMRTNCTKISLPDRLWKPVTDAVAKRAKFEDVRAAVGKMDKDMMEFLIKGASG
jgi:hypothetical protein